MFLPGTLIELHACNRLCARQCTATCLTRPNVAPGSPKQLVELAQDLFFSSFRSSVARCFTNLTVSAVARRIDSPSSLAFLQASRCWNRVRRLPEPVKTSIDISLASRQVESTSISGFHALQRPAKSPTTLCNSKEEKWRASAATAPGSVAFRCSQTIWPIGLQSSTILPFRELDCPCCHDYGRSRLCRNNNSAHGLRVQSLPQNQALPHGADPHLISRQFASNAMPMSSH